MGRFSAAAHPLPAIWKEMVNAGLESGRAQGKALRTVKSCVGSTWCRYGQQDSVSMAVSLVGRYKGVKMAVSGCLRESAEAQGKVLSLTATSDGCNVYVCGNGGARPKACSSLATDIENLPQVPRPRIVAVATWRRNVLNSMQGFPQSQLTVNTAILLLNAICACIRTCVS